MKAIMIGAPSSGSGKTTITMGLIRAILNRGIRVNCFKTGPDYIDTAFLKAASKQSAGNLDMHLQGAKGLKYSLSMGEGEISIIEGAMGFFDGIYNTFENSSYDISCKQGINAVLVYTPNKEMFSCIPKIKGMVEFENSRIKAVILNRVSSHTFSLLKEQIEKYIGIKVLGYIPDTEEIQLGSRHLGLMQSIEIEDLEKRLEKAAYLIEENIDMESLFDIMSDIEISEKLNIKRRGIKVAVAFDKAFSFYYRENLKLLEETCEVTYFSPLKDSKLPPCDLLYLGGGYPEVFREELSRNLSMLSSIKEFGEQGGCIFAECGGFMYLTEAIEGISMAGIFKGSSEMTSKLQRFGYIDIILNEDCLIGRKGQLLTAHEFHKSITKIDCKPLYSIKKTMGEKAWSCGYVYKNVVGGYPHINFLGNLEAFEHMLDYVEKRRRK